MFNRFRRKENQNQNAQHADPNDMEKAQGFICPMCMASLPGPAELQAHFEKVHNEMDGGLDDVNELTETGPSPVEGNDNLLANISKGSLEIALDSNAPDTEKMIILLRQELSNLNVELKEEKWYTTQLKAELEKVATERDKLEEEKPLMEKEYMSQLRSAEEVYFEMANENKKLKEDLLFADYNTTKERHDKLKEQISSYESEIGEDRLRVEGLQSGIDMLKKEISEQQYQLKEEKRKNGDAEKEIAALVEERVGMDTELGKVRVLLEEEINKTISHNDLILVLQEDLQKSKDKIHLIETEHAEQLKKMEQGDQGAVIQELTLEKAKLLEAIASTESTMALKAREHSGELVSIRQEKMEVMVELKDAQLEKAKVTEEFQRSQRKNQELLEEKEQLDLKVKDFQEEIEKKASQLEECVNEKRKIQQIVDDGNDEKEIIMNELRKCRYEMKALDKLLKENEERVTTGNEKMQLMEEKVKNYEISNGNLNGLVISKDGTISELKERHAEAIDTLEEQVESLREDNSKISDQLEKFIQEKQANKLEIDNLSVKISEYERDVDTLENRLEKKEEHLLDALSKFEAAEKELKKACESCKNYETKLCRLQEETKDSQAVITELRGDIEGLNAASMEREGEHHANVAQITQDKEVLQESLRQSYLTTEKLEEEVEGLKKEKEIFIDSACQAEAKINQFETETASLKEYVTNLEDELLVQKTEKESMMENLQAEESRSANERNNLKQEIKQLSSNNQKMLEDMREEESRWANERSILKEDIEQLTSSIQKLNKERLLSTENHEKIEADLAIEIANITKKLEVSEEIVEQTMKSKEEVELSLSKALEERAKCAHETDALQLKLTSNEQKNSELKGDIDVLKVQLQSANEEKSALLERVLSTEDQHKKTKQKVIDTNRKLEQALSALQELGQENQNMQVNHMLKSNRQWTKDDECDTCKKCDKGFSFTVRKHHCRQCGNIFCSDCSGFSAVLASHKKPVRVCESCSIEVASMRGSNVRRLSDSSSISSISTR